MVMEARGWSEGRRGGSPGTQVAPRVLEIQGNRLTPVAPRRNAALPTPGFSTSDLLTSGAAREWTDVCRRTPRSVCGNAARRGLSFLHALCSLPALAQLSPPHESLRSPLLGSCFKLCYDSHLLFPCVLMHPVTRPSLAFAGGLPGRRHPVFCLVLCPGISTGPGKQQSVHSRFWN